MLLVGSHRDFARRATSCCHFGKTAGRHCLEERGRTLSGKRTNPGHGASTTAPMNRSRLFASGHVIATKCDCRCLRFQVGVPAMSRQRVKAVQRQTRVAPHPAVPARSVPETPRNPESRQLDPKAYSVVEVAEMLGVSKSTVKRLIKYSTLPSVKVRGRRLIPTESVDAFLSNTQPVVMECSDPIAAAKPKSTRNSTC